MTAPHHSDRDQHLWLLDPKWWAIATVPQGLACAWSSVQGKGHWGWSLPGSLLCPQWSHSKSPRQHCPLHGHESHKRCTVSNAEERKTNLHQPILQQAYGHPSSCKFKILQCFVSGMNVMAVLVLYCEVVGWVQEFFQVLTGWLSRSSITEVDPSQGWSLANWYDSCSCCSCQIQSSTYFCQW